MQTIPTRVHGMLDYVVAIFLIAMPWVFGFADHAEARWVPVALGIATIIYSLFTDYEYGLIRRIPFKTHLVLDTINGVVLAASPWLFGFSEYIYLPHLLVGLMELGVVLLSRKRGFSF